MIMQLSNRQRAAHASSTDNSESPHPPPASLSRRIGIDVGSIPSQSSSQTTKMDPWSTSPSPSAASKVFSSFKRSFSMNGSSTNRNTRTVTRGSPHLSTPEEGLSLRHNLGPTPVLRPPPTIEQIASGLATSNRHLPRRRPSYLPPHLPPPARSSLKSSSSSFTTSTATYAVTSGSTSSTSSLPSVPSPVLSPLGRQQPPQFPKPNSRPRRPSFLRSLTVPLPLTKINSTSSSQRSGSQPSPTDSAVSWETDDFTFVNVPGGTGRKSIGKVRFSLEPAEMALDAGITPRVSISAAPADNAKMGNTQVPILEDSPAGSTTHRTSSPGRADGTNEKKGVKMSVKGRFFTR